MNYPKNNKKIIFSILLLLVIVIFVFYYFFLNKQNDELINNSLGQNIIKLTNKEDYSRVNIKVKDQVIDTEIVFSQEAKSLGLSGREDLVNNQGMLFIFSSDSYPSFHMKNMNFPLDLLFIKDGVIKKIFANVMPEGENPVNYYNYGPVDMVLELPANYAERHGIKEGFSLELNR